MYVLYVIYNQKTNGVLSLGQKTSLGLDKICPADYLDICMHKQLYSEVISLLDGEHPWVSVLATTVCTIHHGFSHFHWTGFYFVSAPSTLSVGPYQGGHGCLTIPFSRGVCGAAARTQTTQWIRNVHEIGDHIACSSTTNSEVVVPIVWNGDVIAVLDVDSDILDAFSEDDVQFLEDIALLLAERYPKCTDIFDPSASGMI